MMLGVTLGTLGKVKPWQLDAHCVYAMMNPGTKQVDVLHSGVVHTRANSFADIDVEGKQLVTWGGMRHGVVSEWHVDLEAWIRSRLSSKTNMIQDCIDMVDVRVIDEVDDGASATDDTAPDVERLRYLHRGLCASSMLIVFWNSRPRGLGTPAVPHSQALSTFYPTLVNPQV